MKSSLILARAVWVKCGKHATRAWIAEGKSLQRPLLLEVDPKTGYDIYALPLALGMERKPLPVIRSQFLDNMARLSAEGRFLAYRSRRQRTLIPLGREAHSGQRFLVNALVEQAQQERITVLVKRPAALQR